MRTRFRNIILAVSLLAAAAPVSAQSLKLRVAEVLFSTPRVALPGATSSSHLQLRIATDIRTSLLEQLVLLKGQDMLGTEYVLGANRDDAVDCSSLVQQMYGAAGIELPRTTREQLRLGVSVDAANLQPGDLLFYRWGKRGLHVAIYMADDLILHASTSAREVVLSEHTDAWKRRLVAARRVV